MPEAKVEEDKALDKEKWEACRSSDRKPEGKTAYGVKFSFDGSMVCLCGAVIPKDGKPRISLIATRPTVMWIQWLADWLSTRNKKASCVVIDGRNGVDVLIDKISGSWTAKGSVVKASTGVVIGSVGMLTDSVNEEGLTWYTEQEALNDSAVNSVKRKIGQGWGFGGDNYISLPIEAAALALWGAKKSRRDPNAEMRIG
jgi:hypothetical protein